MDLLNMIKSTGIHKFYKKIKSSIFSSFKSQFQILCFIKGVEVANKCRISA